MSLAISTLRQTRETLSFSWTEVDLVMSFARSDFALERTLVKRRLCLGQTLWSNLDHYGPFLNSVSSPWRVSVPLAFLLRSIEEERLSFATGWDASGTICSLVSLQVSRKALPFLRLMRINLQPSSHRVQLAYHSWAEKGLEEQSFLSLYLVIHSFAPVAMEAWQGATPVCLLTRAYGVLSLVLPFA